MKRPDSTEEQEATRLEDYFLALRHDPAATPSSGLDPVLAEITRLAAESERTKVYPASHYMEAARTSVWQKALAEVETAPATNPATRTTLSGQFSPERAKKFENGQGPAYLLPEEPVRKTRPLNWPRIALSGMAATIVVILGIFGLVLLTQAPQTPPDMIGAGGITSTPKPAIKPTPTAINQPTATVTVAPTLKPTPTFEIKPISSSPTASTPYLSATVTLAVMADKFTGEQVEATGKVLETRMLALGLDYARANIDGGQITLDVRGNVSRDLILGSVSAPGRVEFVDISEGKYIQVGEYLQTTYCTSGSLLKPQTGLCVETAHDPRFTPIATGRSTVDGKPFQTVVTGDDLIPESLTIRKGDTGYDVLQYTFKPEAATVMKTFTETHIGKQMAFTLNGGVLVAATIQGVISDKGELTSAGVSLTNLLAYLKSGPLPLPLAVIDMS